MLHKPDLQPAIALEGIRNYSRQVSRIRFNLPEGGWLSPTDEFSQSWLKVNGGCGSKELWSTVYQENSLPKMIEGKAYSRCLRAVLLTDSTLHFSLLSTKETQDTEGDK